MPANCLLQLDLWYPMYMHGGWIKSQTLLLQYMCTLVMYWWIFEQTLVAIIYMEGGLKVKYFAYNTYMCTVHSCDLRGRY